MWRFSWIDQVEWGRINRLMSWYLAWPSMLEWWQRVEGFYTKPFADHMSNVLRGFQDEPIERPDLFGYPEGGPWMQTP